MVISMPRLVRIKLEGRIPRPPPVRDSDSGEWRPGKGGPRFKVTPSRAQTHFQHYISIYLWAVMI